MLTIKIKYVKIFTLWEVATIMRICRGVTIILKLKKHVSIMQKGIYLSEIAAKLAKGGGIIYEKI